MTVQHTCNHTCMLHTLLLHDPHVPNSLQEDPLRPPLETPYPSTGVPVYLLLCIPLEDRQHQRTSTNKSCLPSSWGCFDTYHSSSYLEEHPGTLSAKAMKSLTLSGIKQEDVMSRRNRKEIWWGSLFYTQTRR